MTTSRNTLQPPSNADRLRRFCEDLIRSERDFVAKWQVVGPRLDERQKRLPESEIAHRIRSSFDCLETFLHAQGTDEPDIVSDSERTEIEIKYFCGGSRQGKKIALEDWHWLTQHPDSKLNERRTQSRAYKRLFICFFPTSRIGYGIQKTPWAHDVSKWAFFECLSFTADSPEDVAPYYPAVEIVHPESKNKRGKFLEARLQFRQEPVLTSVLNCKYEHELFVRCDIIGLPAHDPLWCLFYEPIECDAAKKLADQGYVSFEFGRRPA